MTPLRRAGERAFLCEVGDPAATAAWIRRRADELGLVLADVVPAAATVLASVSGPADTEALAQLLGDLPADLGAAAEDGEDLVEIEVRFDGADLADVAARAELSPEAVVARLCEAELRSAFCGFAPGFAYLRGVPAQLQAPRRVEPRVRVPAGAFALADEYAAFYPRESPGGWHLVGTTSATLFDPGADPPALLRPGTRVRIRELG